MAICPKCGAAVTDDRRFCTVCGTNLNSAPAGGGAPSGASYGQPRSQGGYATRDPAYVYTNPENKPINVMSTGGFLGSLIVMAIPVVGLIFAIVWACGGTSSLNRRNLARAQLIMLLIGIALTVLSYVAISTWVVPLIRETFSYYGNFSDFADLF